MYVCSFNQTDGQPSRRSGRIRKGVRSYSPVLEKKKHHYKKRRKNNAIVEPPPFDMVNGKKILTLLVLCRHCQTTVLTKIHLIVNYTCFYTFESQLIDRDMNQCGFFFSDCPLFVIFPYSAIIHFKTRCPM